jgi:hypothetical protein
MTIEEYCNNKKEGGYGVALLERGSGRIITPYCGSWTYSDNGMCDDEIERLEIDEHAVTLNGRYMLQTHSGCYEEMFLNQENKLDA